MKAITLVCGSWLPNTPLSAKKSWKWQLEYLVVCSTKEHSYICGNVWMCVLVLPPLIIVKEQMKQCQRRNTDASKQGQNPPKRTRVGTGRSGKHIICPGNRARPASDLIFTIFTKKHVF